MGKHRYDAVVVGAGPAGASAAYTMAKQNLSVALLERGPYPGSKNVWGGTVYSIPFSDIIPGFWEEAPLERKIIHDRLWFMDTDSFVEVGFNSLKFGKPPFNKFTAYRASFDKWFAQKAVEQGAKLMCNVLAEDLVYDKIGLLGKKVDGVKLDTGDIIYADVVILAEGAHSQLAHKCGLRKNDIKPDRLTLYAKEVIELPETKIEERFNVEKDEGVRMGFIGDITSGMIGKGGIWTNKNTISIMVGGYLDQIINKGLNPYQLLQRMKQNPFIRKLIQGGKVVEYQAHIIPKMGFKEIPKFYGDGVMVVGDAAGLIAGLRGADLAMQSGMMAGDTAAQARAKQDFTAKMLKSYNHKIMNTFFMKNIKDQENSREYYESRGDSDYLASKIANEVMYSYLKVDMTSFDEKVKDIAKNIRDLQIPRKTLADLYYGLKEWSTL